jgi:hypothetical protein
MLQATDCFLRNVVVTGALQGLEAIFENACEKSGYMHRIFDSLTLVIVLILGGVSYELARKGEYEASMGALGTAVIVATSGGGGSSRREQELSNENEDLKSENERLRSENANLQVKVAVTKQKLESESIIKAIEIENARLRVENNLLPQRGDMNLLPESRFDPFDIETRKVEPVESFETELRDEHE